MAARLGQVVLLLVVLAAAAKAEHPYVGTWKMNLAESKYPPGSAPRHQVVTITQVGKDLDHRIVGIAADGRETSARIVIPITDGQGRVLEGANYDGVSVKWFSPGEREIIYRNGGKIINTVRSRISPDGKHMYTDSHGVNARGETTQGHAVYDKQE